MILLVLLLGALLSWVLTLAVRRYAIRSELLDRPNDRSSHAVPTPRGGGLAIVATFLTLATALHVAGPLHSKHLAGLVACAALVAWVGWWDDRHGLAARWRFLAHSVAAVRMMPVIITNHMIEMVRERPFGSEISEATDM